jgi:hypothetical protein
LEKCPRVDANRTITLGTEQFAVERLLGEGGFARVFKAKLVGSDSRQTLRNKGGDWLICIFSIDSYNL